MHHICVTCPREDELRQKEKEHQARTESVCSAIACTCPAATNFYEDSQFPVGDLWFLLHSPVTVLQ